MKTKELGGFKIGDIVEIVRVKNPEVNDRAKYVGQLGEIVRLTKRSNEATLHLTNGETWGAFLENITLVHRNFYGNEVAHVHQS